MIKVSDEGVTRTAGFGLDEIFKEFESVKSLQTKYKPEYPDENSLSKSDFIRISYIISDLKDILKSKIEQYISLKKKAIIKEQNKIELLRDKVKNEIAYTRNFHNIMMNISNLNGQIKMCEELLGGKENGNK